MLYCGVARKVIRVGCVFFGEMAAKPVKCVFLGDRTVGKTCFLITCRTGLFPTDDEFLPSVWDEEESITTDGETVTVRFLELLGDDDFVRVRILEYYEADVIVLCFSLASQSSFVNVKDKWYPEIQNHAPETPTVLLGTKLDLRKQLEDRLKQLRSQGQKFAAAQTETELRNDFVKCKEGKKLATALKAQGYLECSSLEQTNVEHAENEIVRAALLGKNKKTADGSRPEKKLCGVL